MVDHLDIFSSSPYVLCAIAFPSCWIYPLVLFDLYTLSVSSVGPASPEMAPSLSLRPRTGERPPTRDNRDNTDHSLIIPSRTSSLHSRITQPLPSTLNVKQGARSPKTLTHAYMVCGVGREPSQWVKAPAPAQGKIGHMKGAVGTFWLPEILGSSPRLEQDNEIARSLHAAMRVSSLTMPLLCIC